MTGSGRALAARAAARVRGHRGRDRLGSRVRPVGEQRRVADRAFRFGVTADRTFTAKKWREFSRHVEDLGFSTLLAHDHLADGLAPMPALAAAAQVTRTLRVGTLVACNDFHHPVVHAKELATLDVLSDGRAEWGIGAGWLEPEYSMAGIAFDSAHDRVSRLQEAVAVMEGLFNGAAFDYEGQFYQVHGLAGHPAPVQHPHPPLLIGGGAQRMLSFAAREADTVGVAPSLDARRVGSTPPRVTVEQAADRQLTWIRAAAGDRFDDLELNMVAYPALVTHSPAERAEEWADFLGLEAPQVLASPHVWLGSVEQICDSLAERRERWAVSYWVVPATSVDAVAPVVARLAGT